MSTATGRTRAAPATPRRGFWRTLRRIVLVLVAIPLILIPVYSAVPAVSTLMVYSWIFGPIERDWVGLDDISPQLVAAVLMSEDGRFCEHRGVDWREVGKVLDNSDGPSRGASTIPMQTVKNLFLWTSRSYVRKIFEVPLAAYGDLVWGKRRTMEIYLNVIEWGPSVFGAEAAARHYFRRSARQLSLEQSALLAAALPNPYTRDPARPTRNLQAIAARIAARAQQSGDYIKCLYP